MEPDPTSQRIHPRPIPGVDCQPECPECLLLGLMQNADLGIVIFDMENQRLLFESREALELFSAAGIKIAYGPLAELFLGAGGGPPESPRVPEAALSVQVGGRLVGYSLHGRDPIRWLFCRDISEKTRAKSVGDAVELMSGFDSVFSAVRHELGNPINSVKTALTVLRRNFDRFPREVAVEYVDRCLAEVSRIEDLLRSLKRFSVYEAVRPRPLVLNEFLSSLVAGIADDFAGRGVALKLVPDPAAGMVRADPLALQQVLVNLVDNALVAFDGRPSPRVEIRSGGEGSFAWIRFQDNGRGMSEGARQELFRPLATRAPGRAGLGLVIARKVLSKMDGTIEVESTEGVGTGVTITLPRENRAR